MLHRWVVAMVCHLICYRLSWAVFAWMSGCILGAKGPYPWLHERVVSPASAPQTCHTSSRWFWFIPSFVYTCVCASCFLFVYRFCSFDLRKCLHVYMRMSFEVRICLWWSLIIWGDPAVQIIINIPLGSVRFTYFFSPAFWGLVILMVSATYLFLFFFLLEWFS